MNTLASEFIRFVLARNPDARWPQIYDLMCRAAAQRKFRGMGFRELEQEAGIVLGMHGIKDIRRLVDEVQHSGERQPQKIR